MPIDYSRSKIYQIIPTCEFDEGDIYIGSTVRLLSERMAQHRRQLTCSSKILFEKYGVQNCKIELIEEFPCENKEQLLKKEGEHQRAIKCVNARISGRTTKQYYLDNADKIKEYNIDNADKIRERNKQYYLDNTDKKKEYDKQYNIDNADKKKEYNKQYNIDRHK